MGYKNCVFPGEVPDFGAIFMSNIGTKNESFRQRLFGLPPAKSSFVLQVKKGMILFLFEFERRQLYGVFRATSNGEINIDPNAFKSSGRHIPAQVRFTQIWNCSPLAEHEFQDAIRDNYYSGKKFNFGLSKDQVRKLLKLFLKQRIPKKHPEINFWREGDKPARKDKTFVDDRKNLVSDRIGFVSEEDGHGLDTFSEFVGYEVKEVDDRVYLNGKYLEKGNNLSYDREEGNRTVRVERTWKDDDDEIFLTKYVTQSNDFGDHGTTRYAISREPIDHSFDTGLRFMGDVNDEHEIRNDLWKLRGMANKDSMSMMEKIEAEHNFDDGYRQNLTEPHEKRFGEIGVASSGSRFVMDHRIQDKCPVVHGFRQSVWTNHLDSPYNRGSRTINDGRFFGHEIVDQQRTLTEHPERTTDFGIIPDYDEDFSFGPRNLTECPSSKLRGTTDFSFGSVDPITHNFIGRVISINDPAAFPFSKQHTLKSTGNPISEAEDSFVAEQEQLQHSFEFNDIGKTHDSRFHCSSSRIVTMPMPYDPEDPEIRLRPSYFGGGPSSSPMDYRPFYKSPNKIPTSLPMSEPFPHHSQNEGSMRCLNDDPGYALSSKIHNTVSCHETRVSGTTKGNQVLRIVTQEGLRGQLLHERASMSSTRGETDDNITKGHRSNAFLAEPRSKYMHKAGETSCTLKKFTSKEDPNLHDKKVHQTHEIKHLDGIDRRVSVFDRLTSVRESPRQEQEIDTDEKQDLDASVNTVMKMLEKVVSSPMKRTAKTISAFKQEEDEMIDHEILKVKMEPDANIAYEVIESGSLLHETRLVDFKRRKKTNNSLDDKLKESNEINRSTAASCKRRKLVRPVFVRDESTAKGVNPTNNTHIQPTSHANTNLKDDSNSKQAVESCELVVTGETSSLVEKEGNAETGLVSASDAPIETPQEKGTIGAMSQERSSRENHMCGWIEW